MSKRIQPVIKSSAQALKESQNLPTIWSHETLLTQRVLIYIASLLEQRKSKKRKPSAWQQFAGKALRSGKTIKQAGEEWKALHKKS